ncbi:hypothetical protein [Halomonas caseinilytica]|uniref:hypothetical protein n=1 Tax=Halomonas caseinilytica TaxID=438744 RepID=UPI0007E5B29B|nr:hypothetical protein [Halomonas caseinilytica]SEN65509.1 hypothetical protein SAMN04487952_12322 [Halomonas caseinilytica]
MSVTEFRRMDAITPHGEAVGHRFEAKLHEAIQEAEDDGLAYALIIASLAQAQWWMHQRCQEGD